MSATFKDYGLTVADVQSIMSLDLNVSILFIFCHGIHTCIFSIAVYHIAESTQSKWKRVVSTSIVTFLWSVNTVIMALKWKIVGDQFITNGLSLQDEFDFRLYDDTPESLAINVMRGLNTILADMILIWRCWVMYDGNLFVVTIPSLCLITETMSICFITIFTYAGPSIHARAVNWTLVYYIMTVVTNSLCTFFILFRILRISDVRASLKTYRGILGILVESAAMYAAIYVALLIAYAYEFYSLQKILIVSEYLIVISWSITGVAPTLIIARVMAGQSRPDDSWARPSLPRLRTPMRSLVESLRFASAPNRSTGTEQTDGSNGDLEERDVEQEGEEAEKSASASYGKHAEGKSSGAKVEA